MSLSIDRETIPFTMQAEVTHMSIKAAYAAGLFEEMPDEPGMIRMPVVIHMTIPNHILYPDGYSTVPVEAADPDDVPDHPASERRREAFNRMCERPSHEEKAEFRKLLGVLHPGSLAVSKTASDLAAAEDIMPAFRVAWSDGPQVGTGLRTPDATPILHVQYEVKEPEPRPGERELSSPEAANEVLFDNAVTQLRMLEPDNPQLSMLKTVTGCRTTQRSHVWSANWMRQQRAPRQGPRR